MHKLRTALLSTLPGEKAHKIMAPQPKIVEGYEGVHSTPPIMSAVLVLVVPFEDELAIPFIRRVNQGRYHAGQIAFPGGKMESTDTDSIHTALRECQEEIGIHADKVSILGVLSDIYIPLSNFNITPVVGTMLRKPEFTLSVNEVEEVIMVKLSELFRKTNKTHESFYRHEHEIVAPGYKIGNNFIWGATAMIVSEMEQLMKEYIIPI